MPLVLWAKSKSRDAAVSPPTVFEHCRDVMRCAIAIWDAIEVDLANALDAEAGMLRTTLRPLYLIAALLHDLGKANSAFQALVQPDGGERKRQPTRHEVVSAICLWDHLLMRMWLAGLGEADFWSIVWATAGHHLEMRTERRPDDKYDPLFDSGGAPRCMSLNLGHAQIKALRDELQPVLKSLGCHLDEDSDLTDLKFDILDDGPDGLEAKVRRFAREAEKAWRPYRKDVDFQRLLGLLKALVIAADVAASALVADGKPPQQWIAEALTGQRLTAEKAGNIWKDSLGSRKAHEFQNMVAASRNLATVVEAGCGNGKTTAAYMWAQTWAAGRKLFFTYPTTGTASAGFEDYLLEQKELTRTLIHGKALVDLRAMQHSPDDHRLDGVYRLESLQAWDRQAIVCTVDTVLGLIQNQRRPLFSFPAIVSGAFVFDEIHSYDRRLFGELLTFLKTFPGVPVLLMSASIPSHRKKALEEVLGNRMGEVIRGDRKLEGFKRYRLERRASEEACWPDIAAALRKHWKVLWVCNTVGTATELAKEARRRSFGVEPIIYHARFQYRHKVERQKELISEFAYRDEEHLVRAKPGPSLAITTQVCEMSLDLSADLMVTAECPLPSLVQRLGRLNRYAQGDNPRLCLVYSFRGKPYNENEERIQTDGDYRVSMAATRETLDKLQGQPCSQADLAQRLDRMADQEEPDVSSAWLHGGWQSEPLPARLGDQTITVIRDEELADIEREYGPETPKTWTSKSLVPWTIPMLYRDRFSWERRVGAYPLAPKETISYCIKEGAEWRLE